MNAIIPRTTIEQDAVCSKPFYSTSSTDPRNLVRHPEVDALISAGAAVAIGVSGGKDSQAAAEATLDHLDAVGHAGPRILIHSDLGMVEWNDSLPACRALAARRGVELVVVARKAGGLMERWERRWELSRQRYVELSTVTVVPCWSTPDMRFCTSELKTHVIVAELKRRFKGLPIINVTGIRADESAKRAKQPVATKHKDGRIWDWRSILRWNVDDVFETIDSSGLAPHPAYRQFGMSRVSCRFCIMSNFRDLVAAAAQPEAHDLYRRMVALEAASTFAFQGARWLGDVAPHLLTPEGLAVLRDAQRRAALRVAAEKAVTPEMLYVKGWPTRMLTDDEADILACVRRQVGEIMGLAVKHTTRASINDRYAALLEEKARKEREKARHAS